MGWEDAEQPSPIMSALLLREGVHIAIVHTCCSLVIMSADAGQKIDGWTRYVSVVAESDPYTREKPERF